jgi:hypothetical protein
MPAASPPETPGNRARSTERGPGPGGRGYGGRRPKAPWGFPAALVLVAGWTAWHRLPGLDALGLSADEAVYVGQGRGLVGDPAWAAVRAHPPLLGAVLDLVPGGTTGEVGPRAVSVGLGVLTVVLAGLLGRELAGRVAGVAAAVVLAAMPYQADVTRLALVDVPMASAVAVALLLLVRAARTGDGRLVEAAAVALGVATLAKETALLSLAAVLVALAAGDPAIRRRTLVRSAGWFLGIVSIYPAFLLLRGSADRGSAYLGWQLGRRGSPSPGFYLDVVLPRVGSVVAVLAVVGAVIVLRDRRPGASPVVLAVLLPVLFYALWPVTGYPYLPAGALAGAGAAGLVRVAVRYGRASAAGVLAVLLLAAGASTASAQPPLLAGASGVPGLREAARWSASRPGAPVVVGAPWVANVVRYYRPGAQVTALSPSSTAPAGLNPAYRGATVAAVPPGRTVVVWDAWTAASDPAGTARMLAQVRARNGRVAHVELSEPETGPRVLVVCFVLES